MPPTSLLERDAVARLRVAFAQHYTVERVRELLGAYGRSALDRGDLAGVEFALPAGEATSTLILLFLLGRPVPVAAVRSALGPVEMEALAPVLARTGDTVHATVEVRPYGEQDGDVPWWVVSDFGSDVRAGPLSPEHVLGIGAASLTLAQSTPREPVARSLDLGTGCGVQALHLSTHSRHVTATDVSARALRYAATTAALSGCSWTLAEGSLLDPIAGELFDQIVANPPFVVSPGLSAADDGYDYRDSGLAGDAVSELLVRRLPRLLTPGGTASLLANWAITADQPWDERVGGWLAGADCDAWVWQREVAEPGEYVALWLRDAGEQPGSDRYRMRYRRWLDWFAAQGILAVGMGLVTLWHADRDSARREPVVVLEDVPQPVEQPIGRELPGWIARQRWLRDTADEALLDARLARADQLIRTRHDLVAGDDGWTTERETLRLPGGLRWELEADAAISALVAGCDGTRSLGLVAGVLAGSLAAPPDDVAAALLPVVRDLVGRGLLIPEVLR